MSQPGLAPSTNKTMTNPATSASPMKRLLSLDVVRGITICFMIMVNNNGGPGSWGFMNHAEWNGLTPTDLVFPTFVFVVGVSIVFAFESRLAKGARKAELAKHTFDRAIVLFLLGIVVNGFPFFGLQGHGWADVRKELIPPAVILVFGLFMILWSLRSDPQNAARKARANAWRACFTALWLFVIFAAQVSHLRIYGVLQRIAICYLVVGLFYLYDRRAWTKVAALVTALVGYWVLVRWVPVPGWGTPGHDLPFMDVNRNLVSWIDQHLFPYHLYLYPPDHNVRDPEGLLSDLPALGTALMGVLAGIWLRSSRAVSTKTLGLLAGCVTSLVIGYAWSLEFPLNKNMWTSSFVLVAGGYSLALLTLCYWAVEQKGWRTGWTYPWIVFGSNAIAAYMFSELVPGIIYNLHVGGSAGHRETLAAAVAQPLHHIPAPGWAAFSYSVLFTAFCFIPVWILYRRKIFLKV